MNTGELRERVDLKSLTATSDSQGGTTEAWSTTLATVWAKVEAVAADERFEGMTQEQVRRYLVTIRYRSDVTSKMRVALDNARVLKIDGVRDLSERRRWLVLDCHEDDAA